MGKLIELMQQKVWLGPLIVLLVLIIGFVIGLSVGWMTVDFKPSSDDVAAAADSFAFNQNVELAKFRLAKLTSVEKERIFNQLVADRTSKNRPIEAERLKNLGLALGVKVAGAAAVTPAANATLVPAGTPGATPKPSTVGGGGLDPLIAIGAILCVVLLAAVAGVIFLFVILPNLRKSRAERASSAADSSYTAPPSTAGGAQDWRAPAGAPAPTTTPGGLGRFVPTYTLGNDSYDTSYSLETSRGEFLGECGMGISETIGEGKPDKVAAFDLWLFDKADVRTVTQIVMSEYAFRDQALRTKLATKGEAVQTEKGKTLYLETQSLKIEAHIVELIYATNPSYPPNSHFQKLVVEIVPTLKEGVAVAH